MYRWTLVSTLTLAASIFSTVAVSAANEESKRIQSTVPVVELTLGPLTDTHEVDVGIPPTKQCGNDDRLIMPGMAWTVANSMYNSNQMEGTQCTNFQHVLEASDGTLLVEYTSITDIEQVTATEDICKGYSSIGIGVNLRKRLNQVQSIPASFQWNRTAGEEFKGDLAP
jgi:hypothetical protein